MFLLVQKAGNILTSDLIQTFEQEEKGIDNERVLKSWNTFQMYAGPIFLFLLEQHLV